MKRIALSLGAHGAPGLVTVLTEQCSTYGASVQAAVVERIEGFTMVALTVDAPDDLDRSELRTSIIERVRERCGIAFADDSCWLGIVDVQVALADTGRRSVYRLSVEPDRTGVLAELTARLEAAGVTVVELLARVEDQGASAWIHVDVDVDESRYVDAAHFDAFLREELRDVGTLLNLQRFDPQAEDGRGLRSL